MLKLSRSFQAVRRLPVALRPVQFSTNVGSDFGPNHNFVSDKFIDSIKNYTEEELKESFNRFDRDGDGKLDFLEVSYCLGALDASGQGENYRYVEAVKIMEALDQNEEGTVTWEQFQKLLSNAHGTDSSEDPAPSPAAGSAAPQSRQLAELRISVARLEAKVDQLTALLKAATQSSASS